MRKVSICNWPCAELQRVPVVPRVVTVAILPAGRRGRRSTGSSITLPADSLLPRWRTAADNARAFLRAEHAGRLALLALLIGHHGVDQPVAELAVDQAVVVAGPDQVGLERGPFGRRDCGIGVAQAGLDSGDGVLARPLVAGRSAGSAFLARPLLVAAGSSSAAAGLLGSLVCGLRLRDGAVAAVAGRGAVGCRRCARRLRCAGRSGPNAIRCSENDRQNGGENPHPMNRTRDGEPPHPSRNRADAPMMAGECKGVPC